MHFYQSLYSIILYLYSAQSSGASLHYINFAWCNWGYRHRFSILASDWFDSATVCQSEARLENQYQPKLDKYIFNVCDIFAFCHLHRRNGFRSAINVNFTGRIVEKKFSCCKTYNYFMCLHFVAIHIRTVLASIMSLHFCGYLAFLLYE